MGRRAPIRRPARGGTRHRKTRGTRTGATRACRRKPRTPETARLKECQRGKSGNSPAGRLGPGTRKWPQGPHSPSARADARHRNLGTRGRSPKKNGAKPPDKIAILRHAWEAMHGRRGPSSAQGCMREYWEKGPAISDPRRRTKQTRAREAPPKTLRLPVRRADGSQEEERGNRNLHSTPPMGQGRGKAQGTPTRRRSRRRGANTHTTRAAQATEGGASGGSRPPTVCHGRQGQKPRIAQHSA